MEIAVFGQGAWGTALAVHAARAHAVRWWGRNAQRRATLRRDRCNHASLPDVAIPAAVRIEDTVEACADGCEWAVLAVPVAAVGTVAAQLHSMDCAGVVLTCKGMDSDSGRLPSELLEEAAPGIRCAILSGPSFADDLGAGRPAAAVMAAHEERMAEAAAAIFHHGAFRIYASTDMPGVQLGGAVKNVLAIAAGIAHGLQLGDSARAALMTRGVHELQQLGAVLGARPETLSGLSGLGDIVLSCASAHSRNFRLGQLLGEGRSAAQAGQEIGQVTEGRYTAQALEFLSREYGLDLPICTQVQQVLLGTAQPQDAVAALLARPPRAETAHG